MAKEKLKESIYFSVRDKESWSWNESVLRKICKRKIILINSLFVKIPKQWMKQDRLERGKGWRMNTLQLFKIRMKKYNLTWKMEW